MNTTTKIASYIKTKLKLDLNGKKFIDKLKNGNDTEKRLLVCIGIDIKFGLLKTSFIEVLINNIDISKCTNVLKCYDKETDKHSIFHSNFKPINYQKLVRIMDAKTFREWYYNKIVAKDNHLNYDFEIKDQIERGNLENFRMFNNHIKKGRLVWATTMNDIFYKGNLLSANDVVMRLGLSIEEKEYIYIEYPDNFKEDTYQPCNTSVNWKEEGNFYLSYKQYDNYGRTRSHIGDLPYRMREIVHHSIDEKDKYTYNIKYLGKYDNKRKNISNFVNDAIYRFNEK